MRELRRVLDYDDVRSLGSHLTDARVDAFLDQVSRLAVSIKQVRSVFRYPRDPDDEAYLNLALAVKADYLVTRDKDLLTLMTDHGIFAKEFRQKTHPLRVVDPVEFLKRITPPKRGGRR